MAPDSAFDASRPALSLYANLLDPSTSKDSTHGTISRAPVVFRQPAGNDVQQDRGAVEKQQINAATLRFQPTKRPQLSAQKAKAKPSVQRASIPAPSITPLDPLDSLNANARAPARTTLADWTADAEDNDVNGFYGGEKRQRGGRKKRKKNIEKSQTPQNWDDIYDPSRPNNYDDYKHSDEKILEIREWKDRLYAHRMAKMKDSDSDDSEEHYRPNMNNQFAPPPMSFVAPPALVHGDDQSTLSQSAEVANNPTGEDAYSRRMRLSGILPQPSLSSHLPAPHSAETYSPPSPPPPSPPPPPPPYIPSVSEEIFAQQPPPSSPPLKPPLPSISRAPVRYSLPAAPAEIPASEAELEDALKTDQVDEEGATDAIPRSLRPGQKGFAERLMSKYGWSKGSGLGAKGSGIVNPLRVQVEKQKKKPDSEGGGFVGPGGRGKILGGKKGSGGAESEGGKFGAMSEVIVLRGMVDGMDLDAEMEGSRDGGLTQEIGEECGEKYGRVERVYIDRSDTTKAPVFVKFTSQLSALRAVNALEGRVFNGNTITARFFDSERFENGVFE